MTGTVYHVSGSVHDQIITEGAAEVVSEASAEITIVAANIDAIVEVANNIDGNLSTIPEAVASANAAATRAEAAAASTIGIDTAASASALTAQNAATVAAVSAADAAASANQVESAMDGIDDAVAQATDAAELAERWANEAPGIEIEPGRYGAPHYLAMQQALLATAPNLQFRTFGDHAGEEGTDGATQEFVNLTSDFGRGIAVNRLVNRPSRLKLQAGLFHGPPAAGADLAMVPVVVSNIGAADCTIEAPTAGSIVLEPSIIVTGIDASIDTSQNQLADAREVIVNIPAGEKRRFFAVQGVVYHTSIVPLTQGMTCSVPGAVVTQHEAIGNGNQAGTQPIAAVLWSGTLPDGPAFPAAEFSFQLSLNWASYFHYVVVVQTASAVEDADLGLRAGAATSEVFAGLSPSMPESMALVVAMHQGGGANPINIAPGTILVQNRTGTRSLKDFSYAVAVETDRPASPLSYTASSAFASPAVIGGLVFNPVTGTVGGAAGSLLWRGTLPAVLSPGNVGIVWALSDGLRYQLDMVET